VWGGSVERNCGPMNKNRIEGGANQGERARNREALVTKGRRRQSGGRAMKECKACLNGLGCGAAWPRRNQYSVDIPLSTRDSQRIDHHRHIGGENTWKYANTLDGMESSKARNPRAQGCSDRSGGLRESRLGRPRVISESEVKDPR
jgi:hypothetical protein